MSWAVVDDTGFEGHDFDSRAMLRIDWAQQKLEEPQVSPIFYTPVIVGFAAILIFGFILNRQCCYRSAPGKFITNTRLGTPGEETALQKLLLSAGNTWADLTFAELAVICVYIVSVILMIVIGKREYMKDSVQLNWNNVFAHVTAVHLIAVMLPVTRHSVWPMILGLSFERAIKYHRWLGRLTCVWVLVHFATQIHKYGGEIIGQHHSYTAAEGSGTVFGFIAMIGLLLTTLIADAEIRRHAFEAFYYIHIFLGPCAIAFAMAHSLLVRYYMIIPLVLYGIDQLLRFYSNFKTVQVLSAKVLGSESEQKVVRLDLQMTSMSYKPGQYVFVNFPQISLTQWHPYSISTTPTTPEQPFSIHILDCGNETWSSKVAQSVATNGNDIKVKIDGSYGQPQFPLTTSPILVFVAGGIGVTPLFSMIGYVLQQIVAGHAAHIKEVHFIWVSRTSTAFTAWNSELINSLRANNLFKLHFFSTAGTVNKSIVCQPPAGPASDVELGSIKNIEEGHGHINDPLMESTGQVQAGRPVFTKLFDDIQSRHATTDVSVFACGPTQMMCDVHSAAMKRKFYLHKETFLL